MRILWATDLHLDVLTADAMDRFMSKLRAAEPNILVVSGDISSPNSLEHHLRMLAEKELYFVLGNHDFYGSSVRYMRETLMYPGVWLETSDPVVVDDIALTGTDGWYDFRNGEFAPKFLIKDFFTIGELKPFGRMTGVESGLIGVCRELADEFATGLAAKIDAAVKLRDKVVVVTHVPPFSDCVFHEGRHSDPPSWMVFSSKATGDVLMTKAGEHPDKQFTVLCGHTHSEAQCRPLPNLVVRVAGAEYFMPEFREVEI